MSSFKKFCGLTSLAIFVGLLVVGAVRRGGEWLPAAAASGRWYLGKWVPANGRPSPYLELAGGPRPLAGQLVQEHTPGYVLSRAVTGAEAQGDLLLLAVEPAGDAKGGGRAAAEPVMYVLARRGDGHAALYRLKPPPGGDVRMSRPFGAGAVVVYPTDLDRSHEKVADLVREAP